MVISTFKLWTNHSSWLTQFLAKTHTHTDTQTHRHTECSFMYIDVTFWIYPYHTCYSLWRDLPFPFQYLVNSCIKSFDFRKNSYKLEYFMLIGRLRIVKWGRRDIFNLADISGPDKWLNRRQHNRLSNICLKSNFSSFSFY